MNVSQAQLQPNRYFELVADHIWSSEVGAIVKPLLDVEGRNFICIRPKGCLTVGSHFGMHFATLRPLNQKDQRKEEKEFIRATTQVNRSARS